MHFRLARTADVCYIAVAPRRTLGIMSNRRTSPRQRNGARDTSPSHPAGTFIDAFAGAGGLSLGLMRSGWRGLFAIEKDAFAFETLSANFLGKGARYAYAWPRWLERRAWCINEFLLEHGTRLARMRKRIDLLAGGPPCQGFSTAGRRFASDPRNQLVASYLDLVAVVRPKMILLENVMGITQDFKVRGATNGEMVENFADQIIRRLSENYHIYTEPLLASRFGVPQSRTRFFLIGLSSSDFESQDINPFKQLGRFRNSVLSQYGIRAPVSAQSALSDLEIGRNGTEPCPDNLNWDSIAYVKPRTTFQRAMRDDFADSPPDTKLAKHRPETIQKFATIISHCRQEGRLKVQLSKAMKSQLGIKKMATRVLDPKRPAPTVTGSPEDLLHYKEPRVLTVRENARLQSFPDWFLFRGKYATGGGLRRREVPRYTQVANAIPPLMAEVIGRLLGALRAGSSAAPRGTARKAPAPKLAVR